jgi:hypothetical protein
MAQEHVVELSIYDFGWHAQQNQDFLRRQLQNLQADSDQDTVVFKNREGVSLHYHGAVEIIQRWQQSTQHKHVELDIANPVEKYPWPNRSGVQLAWLDEAVLHVEDTYQNPCEYMFGIFINRLTAPRLCMMFHMSQQHAERTLISHANDVANRNTVSRVEIVLNQSPDQFGTYDTAAVQDWYFESRPISIDNENDAYDMNFWGLHKYYSRFYIDIVAETLTQGKAFRPTEKTARPLAFNKPFLVFATKNFLKNLRSLGFRTFDSLWDESYDELELEARWLAMTKVIDHIATLPEKQRQQLFFQAHEITLHNQNLIRMQRINRNAIFEQY